MDKQYLLQLISIKNATFEYFNRMDFADMTSEEKLIFSMLTECEKKSEEFKNEGNPDNPDPIVHRNIFPINGIYGDEPHETQE